MTQATSRMSTEFSPVIYLVTTRNESNAGPLPAELCDCPIREQYVQFLKLWASKLPDFS